MTLSSCEACLRFFFMSCFFLFYYFIKCRTRNVVVTTEKNGFPSFPALGHNHISCIRTRTLRCGWVQYVGALSMRG